MRQAVQQQKAHAADVGSVVLAILEAAPHLRHVRQVAETLDMLVAEARSAALHVLSEDGLHPDRLYTKKQAGLLLGMAVGTVNNQPEALLPRTNGRIMGVDIMAFRGEITHDDARAYKRAKRESVLRLIR